MIKIASAKVRIYKEIGRAPNKKLSPTLQWAESS